LTLPQVLELAIGAALVLLTAFDLLQSVVVPRPAVGRWRLSPNLIVVTWRVWRAFGVRIRDGRAREAFLGSYAPIAVLLTLVAWVLTLILGFGLVLDSQRLQIHPQPGSILTSIYFSALSLITLGFGDYVPVGPMARVIVVLEAATGLGIVAMVISLLFSLYSAFQTREVQVITLDASAGAPPSAVTLLETHAALGMMDGLDDLLAQWRIWCAQVLDSHLAYPILAYFRSSHDNESWLSALGAVLDTAVLMMTTVDGIPIGEAVLLHRVGIHLVEDLAQHFRFERGDRPAVEVAEFEEACSRLGRAGYSVRPAAQAWELFAKKRAEYAEPLNAMARHLAIPPAEWIGDRAYVLHRRRHV
jgi:hypothetical protein